LNCAISVSTLHWPLSPLGHFSTSLAGLFHSADFTQVESHIRRGSGNGTRVAALISPHGSASFRRGIGTCLAYMHGIRLSLFILSADQYQCHNSCWGPHWGTSKWMHLRNLSMSTVFMYVLYAFALITIISTPLVSFNESYSASSIRYALLIYTHDQHVHIT